MKIGIFFPDDNDEHIKMLSAFAMGVRNLGYKPLIKSVHDYEPCDIAVIFGVGKKDVPISWPRGKVFAQQKQAGLKTIVIEKGFVKRDKYYMVGIDGLNNRAYFNNNNCSCDRWDQLLTKIKPMQNLGDDIVIFGQVPSDASVQNVDILEWYTWLVSKIRRITKRNIIFRPHPLAADRTPSIFGTHRSIATLQEDLNRAHVVVTYNSNSAVDAVIQGIPSVSFDEGSMAWDVTGHELVNCETPYYVNNITVKQWAANLAYTQWNETEIKTGLPLIHLLDLNNKELKDGVL